MRAPTPTRLLASVTLLAAALAGCAALLAAQTPAGTTASLNPKLVRKYTQLTAKAATQHGHQQAETLAQVAVLDFTFAQTSYGAQDGARAAQYLDAATQHADRACAILHLEAQRGKTDGMKKVEERLQKITYGLRGLAHSVTFDQQARVAQAVTHFETLRGELLQWMFAPKH